MILLEDREESDAVRDCLEGMDMDDFVRSLANSIPTLEEVRFLVVDTGRRDDNSWGEKLSCYAQVIRKKGAPTVIRRFDKARNMSIASLLKRAT